MATYLLTWNPSKWHWENLDQEVEEYHQKGFIDGRWSCGVTKKIVAGDRVFLIKLGASPPKGIIASGFATSAPFEDEHFSEAGRMALYIDVRYDILLNPEKEDILAHGMLRDVLPQVHWSPQGSGMTISPEDAARLEEIWAQHLSGIGLARIALAEEVVAPERYWEGALRRITVDAYERDPRARKACLAHHGTKCILCGFNFEEIFGPLGKGFIHVHHVRPLAEIGEKYIVDPITDLVPICPNCHAMIHRKSPVLTINEMRKIRINSN